MLTLFTDDTAGGLAAIDARSPAPRPVDRGMLLSLRAQIEENDGDAEGMMRDLTEATATLRTVGERWSLSLALGSFADALTKRGGFEAATAALEESLRLTREFDPHDEPGSSRSGWR